MSTWLYRDEHGHPVAMVWKAKTWVGVPYQPDQRYPDFDSEVSGDSKGAVLEALGLQPAVGNERAALRRARGKP